MTPKLTLVLSAAATFAVALSIPVLSSANAPVDKADDPRSHGPLYLTGNPDQAIQQSKQFLEHFRSVNWDPDRVNYRLAKLPDHDFKQFQEDRVINTLVVARDPEDALAFSTDLYVHLTKEIVPGREANITRSGFYIVGYKDGRVEKVTPDLVRLYPNGKGGFTQLYPGMNRYHEELPGFGDPNLMANVAAFFEKYPHLAP